MTNGAADAAGLLASGILTNDARRVAEAWLRERMPTSLADAMSLGLPEWDARLRLWRVALVSAERPGDAVGEIQIAGDGAIRRAPPPSLVIARMRGNGNSSGSRYGNTNTNGTANRKPGGKSRIAFPPVPDKVILGDCRAVLAEFPPESAQLVLTSPPYYNAKPEYAEYLDYRAYLDLLGEAFDACHSVLAEGRFLVVNVSPVLVRRTSRNASSRRLPIPFDLHPILDGIGLEFIDDIIWRKPEGAGWHLGRGRRFAADRQPLQYKPVTVTEYVLVYRKKTDRLIDWNLRQHPDPAAVERSLILGEYDKTNVWDIKPSSHRAHPAVFPDELVRRIIRYYSFEGDSVLDPFAGIGTVGRVAAAMGRRFTLIEKRADYFETMRQELAPLSIEGKGGIDFDDLQYRWSADDDA